MPELSGLGLLTWVYPPGLVDRVVAACGRTEQRRRLLPTRLVVYFVLGLALFSPAPYLEVLRHLVAGLRGAGLRRAWRMPAESSPFRARGRLGAEPLRVLFAATAHPLAEESTAGAFWRGLRLVAVDSPCWDAGATPANEQAPAARATPAARPMRLSGRKRSVTWPGDRCAGVAFVPDRAGHRYDPLGHADADAFDGAAAVVVEVRSALEDVVDRAGVPVARTARRRVSGQGPGRVPDGGAVDERCTSPSCSCRPGLSGRGGRSYVYPVFVTGSRSGSPGLRRRSALPG
ncbi:transposase domain-containing protein [Streptomyces sp. CA-132043]|uniref:transposase domain-containing protein n=1 Tax=Streptomyces sp. CA-132043 TaxID=3240048 RepID=UPI003D8F645D